jgi:hypothetical protein
VELPCEFEFEFACGSEGGGKDAACPLTGGVISWLRLVTARRPTAREDISQEGCRVAVLTAGISPSVLVPLTPC